jgi:hypothetical protein
MRRSAHSEEEVRGRGLVGRCKGRKMGSQEKGRQEKLTVELLEDSVDGAGAAAAGHADVELVGVLVGHFVWWWDREVGGRLSGTRKL